MSSLKVLTGVLVFVEPFSWLEEGLSVFFESLVKRKKSLKGKMEGLRGPQEYLFVLLLLLLITPQVVDMCKMILNQTLRGGLSFHKVKMILRMR